jgi:hypothetical protein
MGMLFVTNKNSFHHVDMYDGEQYEFPPGKRVAVPEEAATHMFGRDLVDKTATLQRLGWESRYDPKSRELIPDAEGVKKLANFVFSEAVLTEAAQPKHAAKADLV